MPGVGIAPTWLDAPQLFDKPPKSPAAATELPEIDHIGIEGLALHSANDRSFAARSAASAAMPTVFVNSLAADVAFVGFYNLASAAQWRP